MVLLLLCVVVGVCYFGVVVDIVVGWFIVIAGVGVVGSVVIGVVLADGVVDRVVDCNVGVDNVVVCCTYVVIIGGAWMRRCWCCC